MHPFIIGGLGYIGTNMHYSEQSKWQFYLSFACCLLMLPKILMEFFMIRENFSRQGPGPVFNIFLYYMIFSLLSEKYFMVPLHNSHIFYLCTLIRLVILFTLAFLGAKKKKKHLSKVGG